MFNKKIIFLGLLCSVIFFGALSFIKIQDSKGNGYEVLNTYSVKNDLQRIAIDAEQNFYTVSHTYGPPQNPSISEIPESFGEIHKYDREGKLLFTINGAKATGIKFAGINRVTLDSKGNLYALGHDNINEQVMVFDPSGKFLRKWGKSGDANGEFQAASDITIDSKDNVYVLEDENDRVQVFDTQGKFLKKWKLGLKQEYEAELELLKPLDPLFKERPDSISVDSKGFTYIAGTFVGMRKYDTTGKLVDKWKFQFPKSFRQADNSDRVSLKELLVDKFSVIGPDDELIVTYENLLGFQRYDSKGKLLGTIPDPDYTRLDRSGIDKSLDDPYSLVGVSNDGTFYIKEYDFKNFQDGGKIVKYGKVSLVETSFSFVNLLISFLAGLGVSIALSLINLRKKRRVVF